MHNITIYGINTRRYREEHITEPDMFGEFDVEVSCDLTRGTKELAKFYSYKDAKEYAYRKSIELGIPIKDRIMELLACTTQTKKKKRKEK